MVNFPLVRGLDNLLFNTDEPSTLRLRIYSVLILGAIVALDSVLPCASASQELVPTPRKLPVCAGKCIFLLEEKIFQQESHTFLCSFCSGGFGIMNGSLSLDDMQGMKSRIVPLRGSLSTFGFALKVLPGAGTVFSIGGGLGLGMLSYGLPGICYMALCTKSFVRDGQQVRTGKEEGRRCPS